MKKVLILSAIMFLFAGCTKLGEPPMHPSGWNDSDFEDSHMAKIAVVGNEGCKVCHGGMEKDDFYGGNSGVSCYECHAGGPSGHPAFDVWVGSPESANFHGKEDLSRCASCHGTFKSEDGGITGVSCYTCHETI